MSLPSASFTEGSVMELVKVVPKDLLLVLLVETLLLLASIPLKSIPESGKGGVKVTRK